ncbi:MAG TPA: electron transfer flavoprotein subunit beta [Desulfotomaculum sp.]|nr:MAG: Electron transfer flavoprotein beta-subunit [Desulfotomaculum sp. 46_80]HAG10352.1 electron transfer flavoprotein subunit beta [Desulfotomaculum sp.]HBY04141.1 electron transfer flavoprotein subunit beta [Desulfotomaculum sp.]
MQVAVCVKMVPVPEQWSQITFREDGSLQREGIELIINPVDRNALEEALKIRQDQGGTVAVFSMGPTSCLEHLREALAMGADRAFLLSGRNFAGADTLATSKVLAAGIRKEMPDFDLVVCGSASIDSGTAQVGPQLAAHLGAAHLTEAFSISAVEQNYFQVKTAASHGHYVTSLKSPVVISVTQQINKPRIPTLFNIMASCSKEIIILSSAELSLSKSESGLEGSPTKVQELFFPPAKRLARILEGSIEDRVEELFKQPGVAGVFK